MRHIGRTHTHVVPLFGQLCIAVLFALAWAGNIMAQSADITRQFKANSPAAQTNWPQLGHDNAHTGWNRSEKVLSPSTVGQLKEKWAFTAKSIVFSPAVVNGTHQLWRTAWCTRAVNNHFFTPWTPQTGKS
jgi:hypothetical protein